MTKRYPGGYITKTPPTVSTTSAPGIWTLEQQAAYQKAGTWPFGGPFNYIEDVFSTWLYTGTGSAQTITNGIDLAGEGGLVWIKGRSGATSHMLTDTVRGATKRLSTNSANANQTTDANGLTSFGATGFSIGSDSNYNTNSATYASWAFRKQAKFFDVVTYTGTGSARTIAHNLGAVPGCIIVKEYVSTMGSTDWCVYHRSLGATKVIYVNTTAAESTDSTFWNNTEPTSTVFSIGTNGDVNRNGSSYVAYLFAHDAGGFGDDGEQNVISCGSFVGTGAEQEINLGYEPQLVIRKAASTTSGWTIFDNMRGFSQTNTAYLYPNLSNAESNYTGSDNDKPTATGFRTTVGSGITFIYIAIRRGPMKTPTSGTSVFSPNAVAGSAGDDVTTNFPVDMQIWKYRDGSTNNFVVDRLRGVSTNSSFAGQVLYTNLTDAEVFNDGSSLTWGSTGFRKPLASAGNDIFWNFRRAPGFFDVVCYTGTGSGIARNHNLAALPELVITKARTNVGGQMNWYVGHYGLNQYATSISTAAVNNTNLSTFAPVTTTTFVPLLNTNTGTFVTYLFASCPGVSKVGSYTGTGATQTISCGFAARFVLIKRTDSTGNWFVWDTARGMVAGTDPRLALNTTDAELNNNWVYTDASGFQIVTADATVNASGGSYIYLCIA